MAIHNCLYLSTALAKDPNAVVHVKIKDKIIKCKFSQIIEKANLGTSKNLREYLSIDLVHGVRV